MARHSVVNRLSVSIVAICVAALMLAGVAGTIPDDRAWETRARARLCESLATSISLTASEVNPRSVTRQMQFFARRNADVMSVGLRRPSGALVVDVANHQHTWDSATSNGRDGCYVVPIAGPSGIWGQLEVQFTPLYEGTGKFVSSAELWLMLVVVPTVFILARLFLGRVLKHLDPSQVVPERVKETLDNFAEGVLLLDTDERIVLANKTFATSVNMSANTLVGKRASWLPWIAEDGARALDLPWLTTQQQEQPVRGVHLRLQQDSARRCFSVNAVPVFNDKGEFRGSMAAFADVTALEEKKTKLTEAMEAIRQSRDEIMKQNEELTFLATRDPLTSCLNRRTFFERFEAEWERAKRSGAPLSCVMVDIDFFKSVNDRHGHSVGDEVLKRTAAILLKAARQYDLVCRYGGEEFCVLLPDTQADDAVLVAERIRKLLEKIRLDRCSITASLGISSTQFGASDVQGLLDQADKCLYCAKRNGRNQCARWDHVCDSPAISKSSMSNTRVASVSQGSAIPFRVVTALLSTLAYRDPDTAAHSTRVADLAVAVGRKYMLPKEAYCLEVAALLHDIGKIGVPDAILLKAGPLTEEEWAAVNMHDRFGAGIVNASFGCPELTDIVQHHHLHYGNDQERLSGDGIPLGARIVAIADAFDAMVSDRPYRKAVSTDDAMAELRRCAGTQFDPHLVEEFAEVVATKEAERTPPLGPISQDAILNIGQQLERIILALDTNDMESVAALTSRLGATAQQSTADEVAGAARRLSKSASEDAELAVIISQAHELLELCRSMHLHVIDNVRASFAVAGA